MDVNAKTAPASRAVARRKDAPAQAPAADGLAIRRALKLARKALETYVSLAPRLLVNSGADNIHHFRVSSRRLEQILDLLWAKPRTGRRRKTLRGLRRRRRDLSLCRSLDVTAALLRQKVAGASEGAAAEAWSSVREHALSLRKEHFAGARKRLCRFDLALFIADTRQSLKKLAAGNLREPELRANIDTARARWLALLEQSRSSPDAEHLHELRLAGKRLRYRLELLAQLGDGAAEANSRSLKILQDKLGDWHDQHVLAQFTRRCLARPGFLGDRPELRRLLALELERQNRDNDAAMDGLIKDAYGVRRQLENSRRRTYKPGERPVAG